MHCNATEEVCQAGQGEDSVVAIRKNEAGDRRAGEKFPSMYRVNRAGLLK